MNLTFEPGWVRKQYPEKKSAETYYTLTKISFLINTLNSTQTNLFFFVGAAIINYNRKFLQKLWKCKHFSFQPVMKQLEVSFSLNSNENKPVEDKGIEWFLHFNVFDKYILK